jgi:integrase
MANLERDWRSLGCKDGATESTHYDDKHKGLGLRCRKSGGKSWTFEYRLRGSPKKRRVVYGAAGDVPPALTFAQAKTEWFTDATGLTRTRDVVLGDGTILRDQPDPIDPIIRRLTPIVPDNLTVRQALDRYFDAKLGDKATRKRDGLPLSEGVKRDRKSRLNRWLGDKKYERLPIAEIRKNEITTILDKANATGHHGATWQLQRDLVSLFKFCFSRGFIDALPMPIDEKWGGYRKGKRALSDAELAAALKGIGAETYPMRHAYLLLLLTGLRRREVCEAKWSEIDFEAKTWTLPEERTKNRKGHVLPLSDLALAVLEDARRHSGGHGYVLKGRCEGQPLKTLGNAFGKGRGHPKQDAQTRIVERAEEELGAPMKRWVIHDLRRTVRTHLTKLGVSRAVAEEVLNHTPGEMVETYDVHDYQPEMRDALQRWADKLKSLGFPDGQPARPRLVSAA